MSKRYWVVLTVLVLVLPAFAQQPQDQPAPGQQVQPQGQPPPAQGQPGQPGGRQGRGGGMGRGGPGGPGGPGRFNFEDMARGLGEELNLTPQQQQTYDALVAKYKAQEGQQPSGEDQREVMRQMREAQQAGDDAKVQELRDQMRARGQARMQAMQQFVAEVEPMLDADQKATLQEVRQRFQNMGRGRGNPMQVLDQLPEQLGLTPEQKTQFDTLAAEQRDRMAKARESMRELGPLWQELRQARENGDEQRAAELQAQIDAKRPQPPNFDEFFAKLEPILTDAQKAKLAEVRQQFQGGPGGRNARGAATELDVRTLLRVARQLELNDQQKEQLRTIGRDGQRDERAAADATARAASVQQTKARISEILDAKQKADFERQLSQNGRQGRQRGGARGEQQGGGDAGAPGAPPAGGETARPAARPGGVQRGGGSGGNVQRGGGR